MPWETAQPTNGKWPSTRAAGSVEPLQEDVEISWVSTCQFENEMQALKSLPTLSYSSSERSSVARAVDAGQFSWQEPAKGTNEETQTTGFKGAVL